MASRQRTSGAEDARIIGIIGGSGIYEIDGLEDASWIEVESPFGRPSSELLRGSYAGAELVFLPRHGKGHPIPPSEINYRANIDALKRVGVSEIVSLSACGSLREELAPGSFALVDQFVDRTFAREKSFFTSGLVAHVSMAHPVCPRLGEAVQVAAQAASIEVQCGGTYLAMEGPQFSTLAESELYRSWGCDVIGMTNMPEAKLAREAELCYASLAMVTDYDCWHPDHDQVEVSQIVQVLTDNASRARSLVMQLAEQARPQRALCPAGCDRALDTAIITAPEARDPEVERKLDAVAGRVLGRS